MQAIEMQKTDGESKNAKDADKDEDDDDSSDDNEIRNELKNSPEH